MAKYEVLSPPLGEGKRSYNIGKKKNKEIYVNMVYIKVMQ